MKKSRKKHLAKNLRQRSTLVLFGALLAFALLEAGLQAAGFFIMSMQKYQNEVALNRGDAYRIMCVGESTTQGQYPRFLEKILNTRQTRIRFSVIDQGLFATNTHVILEKMESRIKTYRPDAVVAMIGINDAGAKHIPVGFTTPRRNFLQSFKTYRLFQLLLMHIQAKLGELKRTAWGKFRPEVSPAAPRDDVYFVNLGKEFHAQNKIGEAKEAFGEALGINPGNTEAYFELMWLCDGQEQEVMIQKLVEKYKKEFMICPKEDRYLSFLFVQLNAMYRYSEAETLLSLLRSYCSAGWIQHFSGETPAAQGRYEEAIAYYQEAIRFFHLEGRPDFRPYLGLAYVYRAQGRSALSDEALSQGNVLSEKGYATETVENYRKIRKFLQERGIRLICVQYPMRDVEPLKRIFSQNQDQDVSFVDNEKLFKDALKKYRFEEIFRDRFAGDFGHCTDLGNTILAENIAKVILRDTLGISTGAAVLDH